MFSIFSHNVLSEVPKVSYEGQTFSKTLAGVIFVSSYMRDFGKINSYYLGKIRLNGYKKVKEQGKIGRNKKTDATAKAVHLYNTKAFQVKEIVKMCGISSF